MRNFLSNTAGATFFQGEKTTVIIRKDYIEYVVKISKGTYGIVNLIVTNSKQVSLFCSWGNYFDRVNNHDDPNKLFKMLEKQCPTVIDLFTVKSGFECITLPDENNASGIAKRVDLDVFLQSYELVGNPAITAAMIEVLNYSCKLYNEIMKSCPFEGWKTGLREI
ncbi:hypothetical protein [Bacteroides timonensis]|uniref:hypothetical protein n=1 Tax=Bacteroides timonensis TaxID=1470345 RepID=UPI0004AE3F8C|nr:hypothetical protein [Bacteroides timonensis]